MFQKYQLPIKELNELLTSFDEYHQYNLDTSVIDIIAHTEADYVSKLLLKTKLKGPKLTREFVKKLHAGEVSWKMIDGCEKYINQDFDFDLLEELGLIYFDDDWLRISARLPHSGHNELLHDTVKPLVSFIRSLQNIIYSRNDFQPLQLAIDKNDYCAVIPNDYKFEKLALKIKEIEGDYLLEVSADDREISNLVADYYWKIILKSPSYKDLKEVHKYVNKIYPSFVLLPSMSSLTLDERSVFLELCIDLINDSTLLKYSFREFKNIILSDTCFDTMLFESTLRTRISVGPSEESNSPIEQTISKCSSIDEVSEKYTINKRYEFKNNIELFNIGDHLSLPFDDISSILVVLVENDLLFNHQGVISREYIECLLNDSKENDTLRHYLINIVSKRIKDNTYDLYLLSRESEFEIGVLNLIRKVKTKYNSNEVSFADVKLNISKLLTDIIISISINCNKEHELSLLIISFAKNYIGSSGSQYQFEKTLVESIVNKFPVSEFDRFYSALHKNISNIEANGVWPHYTIYLLFLFSDKPANIGGGSVEKIALRLSENIYLEYEKYFRLSLEGSSSSLDSNTFYDSLNWEVCNNEKLIDRFVDLNPPIIELVKGSSLELNDHFYGYVRSIRSYVQVLINLHTLSEANKDKIQRVLLSILKTIGFKSKGVEYPLFVNLLSDESYDLWARFSKVTNDFNEYVFDDILLNISENAPLDTMMSLYSNASKIERRNKVIEKIELRDDWKLNEDSLPAIEKSFILSLEQKKLSVAKIALNAAAEFIEEHPWKNNSNFNDIKNKWSVNSYKYLVFEIFYSAESIIKKPRLINDIPLPLLLPEKKHSFHGENWSREIDLFKRYMVGLAKLEEEPESSKLIFTRLAKEYKSTMFSHLVFSASVKELIKNNSDKDSYKNLIKEYLESEENFDINNLSLEEKSNYIYALFLSGNHDLVGIEYSKLTPYEKFYRLITITYSKSLREKGSYEEAGKTLKEYKSYHSANLNDTELEQEIKSIEKDIESTKNLSQGSHARSQILNSNKSNDELRMIYNEIVRKPVCDLAKIVSNDSIKIVDDFLYDQVSACLKEILKRGRNLEKLIDKKDENSINDWFTSLFNQRLSGFSISLSDQARIGSAESNKNVGETDGLISNYENRSISIFEAMNLKSIDTHVINKHLNKITKYDRESLSPVFIVSYCYFKNFSVKVNDYFEHVKGEQYDGFQSIDILSHQFRQLDSDSEYFCKVETRHRGNKEISIYHILIDLTLPQP